MTPILKSCVCGALVIVVAALVVSTFNGHGEMRVAHAASIRASLRAMQSPLVSASESNVMAWQPPAKWGVDPAGIGGPADAIIDSLASASRALNTAPGPVRKCTDKKKGCDVDIQLTTKLHLPGPLSTKEWTRRGQATRNAVADGQMVLESISAGASPPDFVANADGTSPWVSETAPGRVNDIKNKVDKQLEQIRLNGKIFGAAQAMEFAQGQAVLDRQEMQDQLARDRSEEAQKASAKAPSMGLVGSAWSQQESGSSALAPLSLVNRISSLSMSAAQQSFQSSQGTEPVR